MPAFTVGINGHTKKDCPTLQHIHKDKFNVVNNNESSGIPVAGKNNAGEVPNKDVVTIDQAKNIGDIQSVDLDANLGLQPLASNSIDIPMRKSFLSLSNPLFEEESKVVLARVGVSNIIPTPIASSLLRGQSEIPQKENSFQPALNA